MPVSKPPTAEEVQNAKARFYAVADAVDARMVGARPGTIHADELQAQFDGIITITRKLGPARVAVDATLADAAGISVASSAAELVGVICGFVESGGRVAFIDPPTESQGQTEHTPPN